MLHPDNLHTWNDLLPEEVRETMRTRSKERVVLPSHLVSVLEQGRAMMSQRKAVAAPKRELTEREEAWLAKFVAFAKADLERDGLVNYVNLDGVRFQWYGEMYSVSVPLNIPTLETIYVYYSRHKDGWKRDDHNFPGSVFCVGEKFVGTLAEALAIAESRIEDEAGGPRD